jgi:uncharacterized membrane protein YkvI
MFFRIAQRYLIPGLVIQAVIVGGGYATGRELVEFFLSRGPATALLGMGLTALLFSMGAMVSFDLARRHNAFDYRSFCRVYLGRFAFLFEIGYVATLMLVLSVVSAAAGKLLADMLGTPETANAIAYMAVVAALVFFGNTAIERVISAWSIIFYLVYGAMLILVVSRFGAALAPAFAAVPLSVSGAVESGLSYTGYNIAVIPILIFVARNFQSRAEALVAGALAGPLILLPGFAFLIVLAAFYPDIVTAPLPISVVLAQLASPALAIVVQLVILGALIKTGVGLLHGLNERLARAAADRGSTMPRAVRPLVALGSVIVAVYLASSFGIIDLIRHGYRYASYFFLLVYLLPILIWGAWLVLRPDAIPRAMPSREV